MTPPEKNIFFLWGFVETGAQQLLGRARTHFCPDFIVHWLEWAMPVTRAEGLFLLNGTTLEDFHRLLAHGCAESARPTTSEFCQRKTCSLPWLKAEPTIAGFALNTGTLSSHQNVHPYCLVHFRTTDATMRKLEMTRPWRQSGTSHKLFLLDFIQIIIIILE